MRNKERNGKGSYRIRYPGEIKKEKRKNRRDEG
jgi:hypothetical protein